MVKGPISLPICDYNGPNTNVRRKHTSN